MKFLDRHPLLENLLDIALATVIGVGMAALLFFWLSA